MGAQKGRAVYDFAPNAELAEAMVGLQVAEVERTLILATLRQTNGNRTRAAEILGLSIRTVRNKLKDYADKGFNIPHAA
jgi:DNA-binding NtrC family response regulator